jgi:hypothetical protein
MFDYISGEKIQEICNTYIGYENDFTYNSYINNRKNYHIHIEQLQNIDIYDNPNIIFIYSHHIDILKDIIHKFKNPFILVSHNSDHGLNISHLSLIENSNIIHWYAQNTDIIHHKVSYLPIGIQNAMWNPDNMKIIENVLFNTEKIYLIYFNFSIGTNKNKREYCKKILENKGLKFIDSSPFHIYVKILSYHKFCICPEGNGLDTHRFWEALYCGTVPITLRNNLTEQISLDFPCILLNSWEDFDINNIKEMYKENPFTEEVKNKLKVKYIKDLIYQHI